MNIKNFTAAALVLCALATHGVAASAAGCKPSRSMLVVSANDQTSGYAGKMFIRTLARPGSVSVFDFSVAPVRSWHIDGVPCSVIGPPSCIAINASGDELLVSAAMQLDASANALKPDGRLTRLRFEGDYLKKAGVIDVGAQASGIAWARDGKRAWITLRAAGAVALVNLDKDTMRVAGKYTFASGPDSLSHIELSPDEHTAFATVHATATLLVLRVEADGSLAEKQRLRMPRGSYHINFLPGGKRAVIGCTVDDVICVVEERDGVWAVREKIATGRTPEGVFVSPDGRWIAVTCFDGANMLVKNNEWFGQPSRVYIYSIDSAGAIMRRQTLELKNVLQGAAFTADSRRLVVGQFGEGNLRVFELADGGGEWRDTGIAIEIPGQSAAMTATR